MSTKQEPLNDLVDLLLKANTPERMRAVLETLLTHAEMRELPKRIQIMRMLKAGVPQREIAKTLGVGIATVTRGAKVHLDIDNLVDK